MYRGKIANLEVEDVSGLRHTTCGRKGAGTSLFSSFSQLMLRKKAWPLICLSPIPG